ncbi:MAG: ABC transporter permease [Anaerolineales bacterium]|uniref:ABC transporter permease n=1 Tax=Candidatus Desulfolinea nitratireducens TaxID=2841698 RepID=A0A8J6NNV3_9CHLR|nr:ABC transporter permease [Candidatus Desulfolinea nitratireducens]MBL6961342.1 ABC transporter permease [Anaerolineales bacterium]
MIVLIARRFILALITLLLISIIIFLGVEALPGDAADAYLGQSATPESLRALREEFGLDTPAHQRYLNWLGDMLKGDLGDSMARRKPVSEVIGNQFRNTVVLAAAAAIVGIPLAIVLGVFAGLTRDKWPDILVSLVAILGMTLPGFVTATVLIYVFSIRLEWFPAIAMVPTDAPVIEILPNIFLPIITLTFIMVAHILRLVRTNMIEVLVSNYVQMARLKGVPAMRIVFLHALPNAMLPSINVIALTLAWLLGGVAIIETVFNYPGIGKLLINAIGDRDLALVQGIAIILAGIYIGVNLIADLLALVLNPRLRTSRGH